MKYDKRIATHSWGNTPTNDEYTNSNGVIISYSYSKSIDLYNELAAEAKKDFPELKDSEIECFIITKSSYNQGCAGVFFALPDNTAHKKYRAVPKLDFYFN